MLTFCCRWIVISFLALWVLGTPTADGGRSPRHETPVLSGKVPMPTMAPVEVVPVNPDLWVPAWVDAQRTCKKSWAQVADLLRN